MVLAILFGFLSLAFMIISIIIFLRHADLQTNFDNRLNEEKVNYKKTVRDEYEKEYTEREKTPFKEFVGPIDLGQLRFFYPKTWSMYVDKYSNPYQAYLHPNYVPSVKDTTARHALVVSINNRDYDALLKPLAKKIEEGSIKQTAYSVNDTVGSLLEGEIESKKQGIALYLKMRDKTIILQANSLSFKNDFQQLIKTIKFDK